MAFDIQTAIPAKENTQPRPAFDISSAVPSRGETTEQRPGNWAVESFKDLVAGVEMLPTIVGHTAKLAGEKMKIEAKREGVQTPGMGEIKLPFSGKGSAIYKVKEKFMAEWGDALSNWGKDVNSFFTKSANEGWEAPNPAVMMGWKYPFRKVSSMALRGFPMLGVAAGVATLTKNPMLGASVFFPVAAGDFYDDGIKNGLAPEKAFNLSMATGAGQTALETMVLGNWMKGGSLAKRVFRTALQEGLVEEGLQKLLDNGLKSIGWNDGRPIWERMTDGLAESILAGMAMGGGLGMFQSPSANIIKKDIENTVVEEGVKQGLDENQIVESVAVVEDVIEQATTTPEVVKEDKPEAKADPLIEEAKKYKTAEGFVKEVTLSERRTDDIKKKVRGLSKGVAEKAIANKLMNVTDVLPEYNVKDNASQAAMAQDLLNKDFSTAVNIAMGKELPPVGILPESVFIAVENKAITTNNKDLIANLAMGSTLTEQATAMGQRIQMLSTRDPESPVGAIQSVVEARKERNKKRLKTSNLKKAKSDMVKGMKKSMSSTAIKKETWTDFVNKIKC